MFLRRVLLYYLNMMKYAAEIHRILVAVLKFEDKEMESLLYAEECQTPDELSESLGVKS